MPLSKGTPPAGGTRTGLALLACAVAFGAVFLAPEASISRAPLNDLVFHRAASERLEASLERGEPFLDPWVSEWSLGYPVWRSYPPLAHLLGAVVLRASRGLAGPATLFALLHYLLLVTLPISVYAGARMLGLSPPAAGLSSLLLLASSSAGDLDRYGLGYGAVAWRGSGLFSEVVALHFVALAIGAVARALDTRERRTLASLLLALTLLAHVIFGYVAFVSSAVLATVGPRGHRSERLVRLMTIAAPALILAAWFLVPLVRALPLINHSRWEAAFKWDSYGAPFILGELVSGRLLDFGRPPLLTLLVALGVAGALVSLREPMARRLLALTGVWLALFFGRETWGHLLLLAGVPADLHLHRLQAAFQLAAVLLVGFGTTRLVAPLGRRRPALGALGVLALVGMLVPIGLDRARYLNQNAAWGRESLATCEREAPDLEAALADVRAILAERPGRASAGKAASWGGAFKVGSVPVYAFLSRDHIDQASFLYHAMSKTSDVMVRRDEASPVHDVVFGIRAVLAPADRVMPPHLRRRSVHGRFAVYEASPEGYFGLVDLEGHYTGPPETRDEPSASWLGSPLAFHGIVLSFDPRAPGGPPVGRWQALPRPDLELLAPRGQIVSETKTGETYRARVRLDRPCHVLVKITWSPDLRATVDGRSVAFLHVTPGFGAVAVPAGEHDVVVTYEPGILKPFLFLLGIGLFGLAVYALCSPKAAAAEGTLAARLTSLGERWTTPRTVSTVALIGLAVLALHPLFRGRLIAGHDALAYPPRLVEMAKVLSEGQMPPMWAPDLGAGHGQPLFEFAPPLVYLVALPFRMARLRLADALQLGLVLLHGLGAVALYRLGRRLVPSRGAALGGAACWLFAPYLSLDLDVRAAFAEAAAVAVAPVALLGLVHALDRPKPGRVALGAVAVALVPLAHNAAALLLLPALALTVLLVGFPRPGPQPARSRFAPLAGGTAAIVLGLGLAAYFWVPALLEKGFVHVDRLRESFLHWSQHLVEPSQLLWSPWGYGLSGPGAADRMSFALGPLHLLLGAAGLVLALRSDDRRPRALALSFGLAAMAGAWLSTAWASFVWSHLEALQYLAYPWRALLLPALFLPLLATFVFERLGPRRTTALVALVVVTNLPHTEPKGFFTFDDEYYDPSAIAAKGLNTTTREEYEPRWVEKRPPYDPRRLVGLSAPVEVTGVSRRADREELLVRAEAATSAESPTFYYPGWTVTVDGVPVSVSAAEIRGTMRFEAPAGEHRVVIALSRTPVRKTALLLTLLTALLLVVGARL